ncbi:MAG: glycosyltransferase family 4 protein [Flavobacteriaceae bacterium]
MAANGYDVTLLVADGLGDEEKNKVKITDLGKPKSRINRVLFWRKKVFNKALSINAEIYHFHDPELLPIGRKLINKGKKVIYDVHEDVPRQILTKPYIPKILRHIVSKTFENYENRITPKLSAIVAATPFIRDRFSRFNNNVIDVQNFPLLSEFNLAEINGEIQKKNAVCYMGGISKVRGILTMVKAMNYASGAELLLAGNFESEELRNEAIQIKGWEMVCELGFLGRAQVTETLAQSMAGLVVLEPTLNYLDSIPVKMFEYMAAGIPVIASDFKYWRELIGMEECAVFVNPKDPKEIGRAINDLVNDKSKSFQMGQRGKNAVAKKFNWKIEENKMLALYKKMS